MQDEKTKLRLLVEMVKALSERVDFLSQVIGFNNAKKEWVSDADIQFRDKIKNIEKDIE